MGHALMLSRRPAVGSEYRPYFPWVYPYYGPSKMGSEEVECQMEALEVWHA